MHDRPQTPQTIGKIQTLNTDINNMIQTDRERKWGTFVRTRNMKMHPIRGFGSTYEALITNNNILTDKRQASLLNK